MGTRNIGREMAEKLISIGIDSPEALRELGAKQSFARLKKVYPHICLAGLYALEGAVQNQEFNRLSEETKQERKAFNDSLK